ncbi:MAG: DUF6362 family protein [Magnetococcus sp. YQC-5]
MTAAPPTVEPWTLDRVAVRLEQAADVERLRFVAYARPSGVKSSWPAHQIQSSFDFFEARRPIPSAPEISRAEEAMGWLLWVKSLEVRRLLWSKANRRSDRDLMTEFRRSRTTINRMCVDGLRLIANKLNVMGGLI